MSSSSRTIKRVLLTSLFLTVVIIAFYPVSTYAEPTPSPSPTATPVLIELPEDLEPGVEIYCTHSGVNLRENPTTSHNNVIAELNNGDKLIFLGWSDNGWAHIQFGDIVGYCSAGYLSYDPSAIPTPTPTPSPRPSPSPTPSPTPAPSPTPTSEPTTTPKEAPPASTSGYVNPWHQSGASEKISVIPVWIFGFLGIALIAIIAYKIIESRRR